MVKGKKGFLRIFEATLSVILVLGVMFLILGDQREEKAEKEITEILPPLLNEIAMNQQLREGIIKESPTIIQDIETFLEPRIRNPILEYEIVICDLGEICSLQNFPADVEVYAAERVISALVTEPGFNPKKVKIFIWVKT